MFRSQAPSAMLALIILVGTFAMGATPALAMTPGDVPDPLGWPDELHGAASLKGPQPIWLRAGGFVPGIDDLPLAMDLAGTSSRGIYLVQFSGPLSPGLGERLGRIGARVLGYVPEDGLVVQFPVPAAVRALATWSDLRWACPWQDGWKVHPALDELPGTIEMTVLTWRAGMDVSEELRRAGTHVMGHLLDQYVVRADTASVPAIAAMGDVCWIEPWMAPQFSMDQAARSIGARQTNDGDLDPEGTAMWSYQEGLDTFDGLIGSSVTVDITDTGVDASHPAFAGRNVDYWALEPGRTDWTDPIGHGTHVAGIVLGDGSYRQNENPGLPDGKYAGVAPGAYMLAQSLYGPGLTYFYKNLTKWSVENGADISQNSWGTWSSYLWSNYTVASRDYDNATRDADWTTPGDQSILVVFAAGNSGYNGSAIINQSLTPTASAKNVLAVGAVGNGKDPYSRLDELWLASSRGYTDDGRIKPDLVAPGDNVTSTWAEEDGGASGVRPPESGTHSYINYGGTSMAAPVVSGAAALVMDHLRTAERHDDPSPALVKSILIASADHLPGVEWPGREQGWGRLNVSRAAVETRTLNTEWIDQTTMFSSNGESITYRYDVGAGEPLRIALVWTDVSSATYTGKTLVNDLDLEARSPSGMTYLGNVFRSGGSVTGGDADRTNNVEMVYLDVPEVGMWTVTVSAHELPPVTGGPQDFALSVVGNVNKKFVDLAAQNLSVRATDAAEGDLIPIIFDLANIGNLPVAAVPYRLLLLDEVGAEVETLVSGIVDLAPMSGIRVYTNWTAVRGTYTIKAVPNEFRHIAEESYQNNDASKQFFIKGFGVTGEIKVPLMAARPGSTAEFQINITNTGNTDDLFLLDRTEPPPGWSARLDVSYLDVQSGKTRSTKLLVTVPDGAAAYSIAQVNVTVVSQGNETYWTRLSTQTQVLPVFRLSLDLDKRSVNLAPGEETTIEFILSNIGNAPDTYKVSLSQTSGPTLGVELNIPRTTFSVLDGEAVTGELSVALDAAHVDDLPMGETITFNVHAASVNEPTTGDLATASVLIQQLHLVTIPLPFEDEFYLSPGDPVTVVVEIRNDGNGAEVVTPQCTVPEGWDWEYVGGDIVVPTGESQSVQFKVLTPNNALAGTHTVTALAVVGTEALDSFNLTFHVDRAPSISVRLNGPYDRNMTRDAEISMEFAVTNAGNAPDQVSVEFARLSGGLAAEARPESLSLGVDEKGTVTVVFSTTTKAELLAGTYDVIFRFAEDVMLVTVTVNITIKLAAGNGTPGPDDGDDEESESSGALVLLVALIAAAVAIVVAVAILARRRRTSTKDQEVFFMGREEPKTPDYLETEQPSTRAPPPPPPPRVRSPEATVEAAPAAVPAPRAKGSSCPECGNNMEPMIPAGSGMYCPICGHQEGGDQ